MFLQVNKYSFDCGLSFANKMPRIGVDKICFSRKIYGLLLKKEKKECLKQKITINFKFPIGQVN